MPESEGLDLATGKPRIHVFKLEFTLNTFNSLEQFKGPFKKDRLRILDAGVQHAYEAKKRKLTA